MVESSRLEIIPEPSSLDQREDFFGNLLTYFTVQESVQSFSVTAEATVHVLPLAPLIPSASPIHSDIPALLRESSQPDAFFHGQFLFPSPLVPDDDRVAGYASPSFPPGIPVLEALLELTGRIHGDFKFDPTATDVSTPLRTVLELKRGVCQDFAHLLVACARSQGLPARYVSGYILTQPPPGKPRLIGADASHAWASVWCGDELGWVDLDPTNNRIVNDEYITIGWGRDYQDVSPLRGVILGGGKQTIGVEVTVLPEEHPRVPRVAMEPDLFPNLPQDAERFGPAPVMRALLASQTRMSTPLSMTTPPEPDPDSASLPGTKPVQSP
jgi:transglutaminase-like putative cysteine protease